MSDEGAPEDVPQRLREFFVARGVRDECPFCSNTTWAAWQTPVKTPPRPTYLLYCQNCGFARRHLQDAIDGVWPLLRGKGTTRE